MLDTSLELVALDFETRWGTDFTLKSLPTSEYVRDERFEVHGFGVARQSEGFKPRFIRQAEADDYLRSLPWNSICLSAHNMNFDGLVLAHNYALSPARYFCTQSAARFWHKCETRHSLDALARFYRIAGKLDSLKCTKNKRTAELTPSDWDELTTYTIRDLKIGLYLTLALAKHVPPDEQLLMDATIRMFTQPVCEVDLPLAREALAEVRADKLAKLNTYDTEMLRSRDKFAAKLESMGIEVPMKVSPKTGELTYAFAKKDEDFVELLNHPREEVRNLVEAKLEASSNIDVTRAERLIKMGETGPLAVCLNFAGAHTDRWSGGNKMNIQNFRSGSKLRRAIRAQPEHVLVVVDASQIEARYNGWFCGQDDLLELFRNKQDPYNDMASFIYKRPIDRNRPEDKIPGFVGKTAILGLGYQMGPEKFQATLATGKEKVLLPLLECGLAVYGYRQKNYRIAAMWPQCQDWLEWMAHGHGTHTYKCLTFDADAKRVWFPNGSSLYYPSLDYDGQNVTYLDANGNARYIYGGKFLENIIQKLARNNIGEVMLRVLPRWRIAWMTHDEIVAHVPKSEAQIALDFITHEMSLAPLWAPEIPLAAKGGFDECYSK